MSLIQALLIGCVAALTKIEGGWLGEMKFREPIVTGFLVGLILGDMQQGLIVGAQLQLMWMGAVGIGPTAQLDIGTGFMARVDAEIDNFNLKAINFYHYLVGICDFLMYAILTFIVMYFGNSAIEGIINALPEWANSGLTAVSVMLPCVGFALLLNIILDKSLIPYFIIGFIPAAFVGRDLSMIGIVSIAFAIAWIIFEISAKSTNNNTVAVSTASDDDDEWED